MIFKVTPTSERRGLRRPYSWSALLAVAFVSGCGANTTSGPSPIAVVPTATPVAGTPTPTPAATATPTAVPTATATATATAAPTATPARTATPVKTGVACTPYNTASAQTMNPAGGTLSLPACGTFTGRIAYPSFTGNTGTISATILASQTNNVADGGGAPAHLTNSGAFLYVAINLFSSKSSDASVVFGSLASGAPASCGQVDGAFASGTTYYMSGQYPQMGSLAIQTVHNAAGSGTLQGAGCALDGENVFLGNNANIIIFSTSDQFFN